MTQIAQFGALYTDSRGRRRDHHSIHPFPIFHGLYIFFRASVWKQT